MYSGALEIFYVFVFSMYLETCPLEKAGF